MYRTTSPAIRLSMTAVMITAAKKYDFSLLIIPIYTHAPIRTIYNIPRLIRHPTTTRFQISCYFFAELLRLTDGLYTLSIMSLSTAS